MELARFPSRGRFSVRSIFIFALTAFTTVLLWVLLSSTPVGAADASWNGASIEHGGRSYYLAGTSTDSDGLGIPAGSKYYISLEETPTTGSAPTLQKGHVIYLAPGADPPGDGTATYLTIDYNPTTKKFSNPGPTTAITIDTASFNAQATTCAIESVGWFVCPAMNFLAWGMDTVFGFIAEFMEVQPLQVNNTDGALYNAWNIMRSIANIAFIIVFIIIIYSQLTSVGIGNYGIKKMLPRLIIAAIAINVSYIIAAAAVDVSNILGFSIHQMLTDLRNTLMATGSTDPAATASLVNFESITGFVLSGGTAALAGVIGVGTAIVATGGMATAAVFILLPALVGLLLTVLLVLLILAARQALIVILVIIAPLALVAYLLPNTEKWFDKWRDTFMTMLIFFPAFSVVFGGSQLAGGVIIQNASSLNMLILGLIVQVAPLVITPLLLKFSGSVLGGVAKLINDPNKGLVDRTRNWAKPRAEMHAERGRGGLDRNGNLIRDKNGNEVGLRKRNPLRQSARYLDQRRKRVGDRTELGKAATQDAYENSRFYTKKNRDGTIKLDRYGKAKADISQQKALLEHRKEATHAHHADVVDQARRTQGSMLYQPGINAEAAKERAEASKNATAQYYNGIRYDYDYANKVGGKALHMSSYGLEVSKATLEESQNNVKVYYDIQRATSGTELNRTVRGLETSKLNVEIAGNNVTTMVENMKLNVTSDISVAARNAQSSKEHLEVAQNQLQAFFDTRRATDGTELNLSTTNLERSKSVSEKAKSELASYIINERTAPGGSLVTVTSEAASAQLKQQKADAELSKMIDELKSGKKDPATMTTLQRTIMEDMNRDAIELSAIKRGGESAQYELQSRFAEIMTGADPADEALTEQMRTIAQGVGGDTARVRAISTAVATARGLDSDGLKSNVQLLTDEARRNGTNIKYYSKDIIERVLEGKTVMPDGTNLTPERIKAALQAQAEEKNIPIFEKVGGSPYFDQSMVREIISLNSAPFKGAGAFAMQDKLMTLADFVDDFSDDTKVEKGKKAYAKQLSLDHISNLANANATGIAGWKMGEVVEVAKTLGDDVQVSLQEIKLGNDTRRAVGNRKPTKAEQALMDNGEAAQNNLKSAYKTVRDALSNPDIVATMNDRESFVRTIESELARIHGQTPTPDTEISLQFDADSYTPSAPVVEAAETLPENTQDTDNNGNTPTV